MNKGDTISRYRIVGPLGKGGMGVVYQAEDTRLNRPVALKFLSAESLTRQDKFRFLNEAQAAAAARHPNICPIYDVEEVDGTSFIVMAYLDGETLLHRIKRSPLEIADAIDIAIQIAAGLECAHQLGIVHRDIKSANIIVGPGGHASILDFGLALVSGETRLTTDGQTVGTAFYMSPEQARGKVVDKRADIWAFGVVLYEMVTGRRLFEGEDVTETLALVIKGEPKWDGIPANVQRLLKSCLEKDPKHRLRDIGDAWRLLEGVPHAAVVSRSWLGIAGWIVAVVVVSFLALDFAYFRERPRSVHAVRIPIAPPAQSNFTGNDALLSPDGHSVAFQAIGQDGRNQLWVRSLDSLESRPLAGTQGLSNASCWSPDSRYLAFPIQGKVKRIEVSGGLIQTVCDIPGTVKADDQPGSWRAGAWSRQGVIIFGANGTGLWKVPEGGGTPSELTVLDPARAESFHAGPSFLPDGRHFFYHRIAAGNGGVYLGSLDVKPAQQSSRRLLESDSSAVFAPSSDLSSSKGHVLFVRAGSLMAQPFDAGRQELSGEAVPVVEGVSSGASRHFSASMTGALAYQQGGLLASGVTRNQLTWFDREGRPFGTAGETGAYNSLALSPDGARVAVSSLEGPGSGGLGRRAFDIWVHEFARNTSTRLTTHPAWDWLPVWSPDGQYIAYSSERDDTAFNLYRKLSNAAGDEELLLKTSQDKIVQDWSHDGRFLLYAVAVTGGRTTAYTTRHDLWVLPVIPGKPEHLKPQPYLQTEFNETQGKFSPDGRFIAYRSDASGSDEVYVQPFPAASTGSWKVSTQGGFAPQWSRDGKEMFYISADSKMMVVKVSADPDLKIGIPKALFPVLTRDGPKHNMTPYDVTADGKKFLIISGGPSRAVPIMVVLNWTALLKK